MFVIVDEIIPSLFECSAIDARVLPGSWRVGKPNWAIERLGCEMVYGFAI